MGLGRPRDLRGGQRCNLVLIHPVMSRGIQAMDFALAPAPCCHHIKIPALAAPRPACAAPGRSPWRPQERRGQGLLLNEVWLLSRFAILQPPPPPRSNGCKVVLSFGGMCAFALLLPPSFSPSWWQHLTPSASSIGKVV